MHSKAFHDKRVSLSRLSAKRQLGRFFLLQSNGLNRLTSSVGDSISRRVGEVDIWIGEVMYAHLYPISISSVVPNIFKFYLLYIYISLVSCYALRADVKMLTFF